MRGPVGGLFVYRPGALGDTLLSLPALANARKRFNATSTIFAGAGPAVCLLAKNSVADLVLSADDPRLLALFSGAIDSLFEQVGRLDTAVLWGGQSLIQAAAALRGAGISVIHAPSRPPAERQVHVSEFLLESIGVTSPSVPRGPHLRACIEDVYKFRETYPCLSDSRLLSVHLGSGSMSKNWSPDSFATLCDLARGDLGWSIALIGGPAEDGVLERVLGSLERPPDVVSRNWPLTSVAALLSCSDLYLGNDSGISHLAGCVGVPGVALFGPSDPVHWAPLGGRVKPIKQPSMTDHDPTHVLATLQQVELETRESRALCS